MIIAMYGIQHHWVARNPAYDSQIKTYHSIAYLFLVSSQDRRCQGQHVGHNFSAMKRRMKGLAVDTSQLPTMVPVECQRCRAREETWCGECANATGTCPQNCRTIITSSRFKVTMARTCIHNSVNLSLL